MQTLGLSGNTPKQEGFLKSLFWPEIQSDAHADYVSQQGFWVCFTLAMFQLFNTVFILRNPLGALDVSYLLLAAAGVRERSQFAAVIVFLNDIVSLFLTSFGILPFFFVGLLLSNVRATWLSAKWKRTEEPMPRLDQTLGDQLCDQMPAVVWPLGRWLFYPLAALETIGLHILLYRRV